MQGRFTGAQVEYCRVDIIFARQKKERGRNFRMSARHNRTAKNGSVGWQEEEEGLYRHFLLLLKVEA